MGELVKGSACWIKKRDDHIRCGIAPCAVPIA